ncbi:glutamic-type intramembrane protease PrsW [Lederbergia galactosidilytica]|uniref:Protease PrsW n=1 Tax=Lederbergia galactosidilytica TaxID=217031 RepID=A0A178A7A9_9BACI|nr:glutamic-type intramembrane protease PrsW [Lederbergia galactosidilytica]KRG09664.1 protease [Virgibacillus soli]MBP1914651.1 RsiW-degrading membrane proteinase PrsW (M82 family) [Lederbergia galactosidilytica]OAK75813.1 protease [Lederbergia galactosidilytica]
MFGILSAGIAPGLALISYFYLRDQYGQEPVINVFKMFLFGAILTFPIMFMQYVIDAENIIVNEYLHSFISAAFLEEFFKWFILFLTIYPHADFDEPYDGIVYGASISLGFATVENILYLLGNGIEFAMGRALLPVSSHALFGVLMGYYLGKAKFNIGGSPVKWICFSFITPFILHGFYDSILVGKRWIYYIIPFMLFLWYVGLKKAKHAHRLSEKHIQNKTEEKTAAF